MSAGRPTALTPEALELAWMYLDGGWQEQGDVVPQIAGLALAMGVTRETIYQWSKQPDNKEFSDIFTRVMALQERGLINNGLAGGFNPAITKMLLTKHGYSDKVDSDITSSDGSMTPTRIEIVAADDDSSGKTTA